MTLSGSEGNQLWHKSRISTNLDDKTGASPLTHPAGSVDEALTLALDLARSTPSQTGHVDPTPVAGLLAQFGGEGAS